jgi:hypothetical protein
MVPYQCYRTQCQQCIDYQAGLIEPAFPMPALPYTVQAGLDGKLYAVFEGQFEAEAWEHAFPNRRWACFGSYENAYCLND